MKILNKITKLVTVIAVALASFSCTEDEANLITKYPTIEETLKNDPNYSILYYALNKTDLLNTFRNAGSFTLFAPDNTAFIAAGIANNAAIDALTTSPNGGQLAALKRVLQYHVITLGTVAADFPTTGYVSTFSPLETAANTFSTSISISLFVNKSNGVVLNGGTTNGGATVTTADVRASNGVIHKISNVLGIPKVTNFVVADPNLSTLLGVVTSGPQAAVLTGINNATVGANARTLFAPTNTAFTNATFLTGQTDANITKVLNYHMASSNRRSSSATSWSSSASTIATLLTGPVQNITIPANTVNVTDVNTNVSKITTANIQASNGVIHIIDRVLQPTL
jgi:uncharacterized surface protein with fasciclin (FAS1) repeats